VFGGVDFPETVDWVRNLPDHNNGNELCVELLGFRVSIDIRFGQLEGIHIKPKCNRVFYSQINKYMHFRITLYVAYANVICEDIF
jgi:hypothetical protein